MAIWSDILTKILGPIGDASAIVDLLINLNKGYDEVYQRLPDTTKARLNLGDSFQRFAGAVAKLTAPEREAIRDLLATLRADQAKQERFILRAVVQGGLENEESTLALLRDLATMDTAEALQYLEDLDFTQPSTTLLPGTVTAAVTTAKQVGTAIKTAEAKVSTAIDNSRARKLLDRWATALENKTGIKP